jgi:nucleoside-diphosphate-sugar epimerase
MSHYVVTGGAGFIGSAIVRSLLREGAGRIVVIDNLLSGSEANLEQVRGSIEFHRADIRDYEAIAPLLRGAAVVFHEAAIPSVPRSIDDPVPSHDVNINGTFNVLRAAREGKAGRVVYAASSSAYGDTEVLPKVEDMTPRPKSPYALQKLVGEYYCSVFSGVFGLETVALRYFNVYGPRQDPSSPYSGVLSVFMKALLERRSPTIFGDGQSYFGGGCGHIAFVAGCANTTGGGACRGLSCGMLPHPRTGSWRECDICESSTTSAPVKAASTPGMSII